MSSVVPALCPCCDKILYLAKPREENGKTLWLNSTGTPPVQSDAKGPYIRCQHCFKRIAVSVVRETAEGTALEISEQQDCG